MELSKKGNGNLDDWMVGGNSIGERAKGSLVKQVVAMANTRGGALFLGIRQSEDKPPVAADISAVPRCPELADQLTSILLSRVEPLLPSLEVFPVETCGDDGLVVIRVGKSRQAPHRDTKTLKCYVRRHDQCRELRMWEIQDMTLNVSRGLQRVEKQLLKRAEDFPHEWEWLNN